jgi:hypothetical protein
VLFSFPTRSETDGNKYYLLLHPLIVPVAELSGGVTITQETIHIADGRRAITIIPDFPAGI